MDSSEVAELATNNSGYRNRTELLKARHCGFAWDEWYYIYRISQSGEV